MDVIQNHFCKNLYTSNFQACQTASGYEPRKQNSVKCTNQSPGKSFGDMSFPTIIFHYGLLKTKDLKGSLYCIIGLDWFLEI